MSRLALVGLLISSFACAGTPASPVAGAHTGASPTSEPDTGAPVTVTEPAPALFSDDDMRYGYRDSAGEVVIEPQYLMAEEFVDQVAAVAGDDGWMFIDRRGARIATAFVFDNYADEFAQGRARIVEGEGAAARYGFVASTGAIVVAPTWAFALPFSDGLAAVCEGCVREEVGEHFTMTGGKWGYIGLDGAVVIAPRFARAEPFAGGRATVEEGGRTFAIGPDGVEVAD